MPILRPKRIGLALGSGAARGIAHIGVLKALEAEGLAPDVVAGTSMGALVGAFYAAGIPLADIEAVALDFDVTAIAGVGDMTLGKGGVFSGDKVQTFLRAHLPETFEELRMPFGCVATDITHNRAVRFTSGHLISALRASCSVPVTFLPVRMDGALLIDGYVSEPVPVRLARHLGGQIVVAVDVSGSGRVGESTGESTSAAQKMLELRATVKDGMPYRRGQGTVDILGAVSEAFEGRVAAPALKEANVVISPAVHHMTGTEFGQAAEAIAAGEAAALAAAPAIRRAARR